MYALYLLLVGLLHCHGEGSRRSRKSIFVGVQIANDGGKDLKAIFGGATQSYSEPEIPYMISPRQKIILVNELGYSRKDVNNLSPDVAAVLIKKRFVFEGDSNRKQLVTLLARSLIRPRAGVPPAWQKVSSPPTKRERSFPTLPSLPNFRSI